MLRGSTTSATLATEFRSSSDDGFKGLHPHILLEMGSGVLVNNSVWFRASVANGGGGEVVVHMQWGVDEGGEGEPPGGHP